MHTFCDWSQWSRETFSAHWLFVTSHHSRSGHGTFQYLTCKQIIDMLSLHGHSGHGSYGNLFRHTGDYKMTIYRYDVSGHGGHGNQFRHGHFVTGHSGHLTLHYLACRQFIEKSWMVPGSFDANNFCNWLRGSRDTSVLSTCTIYKHVTYMDGICIHTSMNVQCGTHRWLID